MTDSVPPYTPQYDKCPLPSGLWNHRWEDLLLKTWGGQKLCRTSNNRKGNCVETFYLWRHSFRTSASLPERTGRSSWLGPGDPTWASWKYVRPECLLPTAAPVCRRAPTTVINQAFSSLHAYILPPPPDDPLMISGAQEGDTCTHILPLCPHYHPLPSGHPRPAPLFFLGPFMGSLVHCQAGISWQTQEIRPDEKIKAWKPPCVPLQSHCSWTQLQAGSRSRAPSLGSAWSVSMVYRPPDENNLISSHHGYSACPLSVSGYILVPVPPCTPAWGGREMPVPDWRGFQSGSGSPSQNNT